MACIDYPLGFDGALTSLFPTVSENCPSLANFFGPLGGGPAALCSRRLNDTASLLANFGVIWSPPANASVVSDLCAFTCLAHGEGPCVEAEVGAPVPASIVPPSPPPPPPVSASPRSPVAPGTCAEDSPRAFAFATAFLESGECGTVLDFVAKSNFDVYDFTAAGSCNSTLATVKQVLEELLPILPAITPPAGYTFDSLVSDFCPTTCRIYGVGKCVLSATHPPPSTSTRVDANITQPPSDKERKALVRLYESTGGVYWKTTGAESALSSDDEVNRNWNDNGNACHRWRGVGCDLDGKVRSLWPNAANLTGTLPTQIGWLSNLRQFSFYSNQISGTLPTQIGALTQLRELIMFRNLLRSTLWHDAQSAGQADEAYAHGRF